MTKRALLIGINYFGTPNELAGCINDAKNMGKMLGGRGFQCTYLLDDGSTPPPTRNNILAAIQKFVLAARRGDELVFHFSGHGSHTRDGSGDEDDGRDEVLCPLSGPVITDDTLRRVLTDRLPLRSSLLMVLDCCHSGTAGDLRCTYEDISTTALRPCPEAYREADWTHKLRNRDSTRCKDTRVNVVCLSGCRDTQYSADTFIGNQACGAMTAALLWALDTTQSVNVLRVFHAMSGFLRCSRYGQRPQLSLGNGAQKQSIGGLELFRD